MADQSEFALDLSDDSLRFYNFPGGISVHFTLDHARECPSKANMAILSCKQHTWEYFPRMEGEMAWYELQKRMWQFEAIYNAGKRERSRELRSLLGLIP